MRTVLKTIILAALTVSFMISMATLSLADNRNEGSGSLKFNSDGKFTIMQVADPQDNQNPRKAMIDMLNAAYDKVQPDLVVFTGDNVLGRIGENKSYEKNMNCL